MTREANRRALVLGGTGFLGAALAGGLRDAGAEVTVFARRTPDASTTQRLVGCRVVIGDADEPDVVEEMLDDVDILVHAIGRSLPAESNADPVGDASTSLTSILRTLEAVRRRPSVRLFYLSSGGAIYGNAGHLPVGEGSRCRPISSYGVMKLAAEHYLGLYAMLYGVCATSLRVSNAYGPGQPVRASQGFVATSLDAVRRHVPVRLYGDGLNVRDYVHIGDIVRATVDLIGLPSVPGVLNVASGTGTSLLEVLDLVAKVTGESVDVEHLPGRSVDVRSIVLDTSLLSTLVPWAPMPMEAGLSQTWEELVASGAEG